MATLKGFMRSYGAAVRRAERAEQKRAREAAKRYKEQLKQKEISNAKRAVQTYREYIEMIQSFHKNCTKGVDWNQIKNTPKPTQPKQQLFHEASA